MEDSNVPPEPPAGMLFTNIIPMSRFGDLKSSGGYEILEQPHAQENYTRNLKHRRNQLHKSGCAYFTSAMLERRLRLLANSGYNNELQEFLESADVRKVVNRSDSKNRTALHFAASRGSDDIVQLLLMHGANPNLKDFNGNTPLHLAACTHHIRVITLLLRHGADVKATDSFGKTPLHLSLSRLKMLQSKCCSSTKATTYTTEKRKAEVGEIVAMLKEYFEKCGKTEHHVKMCEITQQLWSVKTHEEVEEVNSLLATFTQMTIDAAAKSRMPEE